MLPQPTVNTKEALLTYKEVALLLQTSTRTVERMAKADPDFPVVRVGSKGVRFIWEDVLCYLRTKSGNPSVRLDLDLPGLR